MKVCTTCKILKADSDFYKNAHCVGGIASECKDCDRPKNREKKLKQRYGITTAEYDEMLALQGSACYICQSKDRLVVDHDHSCKVKSVRKIICNSCNSIIGHANDSITLLEKCIQYIKEHNNAV